MYSSSACIPERRPVRTLLSILLLTFFVGFSPVAGVQAQSPATYISSEDVQVVEITDGVWLHVSWNQVQEWGRVRSNGMILADGEDVFLIDTAWNDAQTEQLLGWIKQTIGKPVRRAVLTHAHSDRMGGIGALKKAGVVTYAHPLAIEKAPGMGWARPDSALAEVRKFTVGSRTLEVFFPGPAHTEDNLVAWLPDVRLLYGGCLLKEAGARSLGNLADADQEAWPATMKRLIDRYPDTAIAVPSHGPIGGRDVLDHTLSLAEENLRAKNKP